MKNILLATMVLLSTSLYAAQGDLGLGLMLGNPTGVNGKYWLSDEHAVDGGVALSLGNHTNLSLHSDYLFHNDSAFFLNDVHALDFYYGIGGRMEFDDELEVGVRIPFGLAHKLNDQKADIFAEIAPIVDFLGRTGLEMHFGVGARYYF